MSYAHTKYEVIVMAAGVCNTADGNTSTSYFVWS